MPFKPPVVQKQKARIAIEGVAGVGKSKTGLGILRGLVGPDGRIAAIDTEHGRLSGYAGVFPGTAQPLGFDASELVDFGVEFYIEAIQEAAFAKYDGLLIDSVSHAWAGKGGILELVDKLKAESSRNDAFGAGWREATPKHNRFIDAICAAPMHVIVTIRQKADYVMEKDAEGNTKITKVGMAPIQRDGFDYEFDLIANMDREHTMMFSKVSGRFEFLDGAVMAKPDPLKLGQQLRERLDVGDAEWQAPNFARTFKIGDRIIETRGVTFETYTQCLQLGASFEKATKVKGSARTLMSEKFKVASVSGLTEKQAHEFIDAMREKIAAASETEVAS